METAFTLLFGLPGGSEWIMIIIGFVMPIVVVIYLINKYLKSKNDKQVVNDDKHIIRKL